jgi:hypothetical protein
MDKEAMKPLQETINVPYNVDTNTGKYGDIRRTIIGRGTWIKYIKQDLNQNYSTLPLITAAFASFFVLSLDIDAACGFFKVYLSLLLEIWLPKSLF